MFYPFASLCLLIGELKLFTCKKLLLPFCSWFLSAATATTAKSLQSCPTLCDPGRQQPTRLPRPWDSPGKNTGVGCHFLLQCMKVKSESEVAQSCPTLSDPMDCSRPGSAVPGIFQARVLEWGAIAFSGFLSSSFFALFSTFAVFVLCFIDEFLAYVLIPFL